MFEMIVDILLVKTIKMLKKDMKNNGTINSFYSDIH